MTDRDTLLSLLRDGNKIGAIKALVDAEGADLRSAKEQVEALETELQASAPTEDGIPIASDAQKRAEMIHSEDDLHKAIASPAFGWRIVSFEKIPMGWRAHVSSDMQNLWFSSERGDIVASLASQGFTEEDRRLGHPNPQNLSDFQKVCHILEKVQQAAAPNGP